MSHLPVLVFLGLAHIGSTGGRRTVTASAICRRRIRRMCLVIVAALLRAGIGMGHLPVFVLLGLAHIGSSGRRRRTVSAAIRCGRIGRMRLVVIAALLRGGVRMSHLPVLVLLRLADGRNAVLQRRLGGRAVLCPPDGLHVADMLSNLNRNWPGCRGLTNERCRSRRSNLLAQRGHVVHLTRMLLQVALLCGK